MDIVIIINNRRVGVAIIGGELDGVEKSSVGGFLVLYVKLNTTLFSFFFQSTNGHIFPIEFNTKKLRNDGF